MHDLAIAYDNARELVQRAKDSGLVIGMSRVGAAPYFMHTPYENHQGVEISMWSCISMSFERMPDKTLLSHPTIVKPWEEDSWEINQITDEWLVNQVARMAESKVELYEQSETPFGDFVQWKE